MLGKLMKYEFMAMGRVFLPLYGALIIISIVNSIFGRLGLEAPNVIGIVVSVLLIAGIMVMTLLLIIQRFWSNLLSSEGYLMMTLPVSTNSIILSKLFVAAIWTAASTIVVTLSIFIMTMSGINLAEMIDSIRNLMAQIPFDQPQLLLLAIELLLYIVLSTLSGTLLLYACMSLSMMSNKYRWLVAIGSYIAWTTALQILGVILIAIGTATSAFSSIERFLMSYPTFGTMQIIFIVCFVLEALFCTVYYITTRYMLSKRLNLQ